MKSDQKAIVTALRDEIVKICLEANLLPAESVHKVLQQAKQTGISALELLFNDGLLDETKTLEAIRDRCGVPIEQRPEILVDEGAVPTAYFKKNGLIPLAIEPDCVTVGIAAPSALNFLKNASLITGKKITPVIVSISWFERNFQKETREQKLPPAIKSGANLAATVSNTDKNKDEHRKYQPVKSENTAKESVASATISAAVDLMVTNNAATPPVKQSHQDKKSSQAREKVNSSASVIGVVDEVLSYAVDSGVSDIHVEVFRDGASLRIRRNGTLFEIEKYRKYFTENYNAVVSRIKILSNLDIAEKRLPQDGKISFKSQGGREVDFRVSVLPTNLGERIVIRILSAENLAVSIAKLGFAKYQEKDFLEAIESPQGMVLVTGPTGSGKSTTLYGAISHLNNPGVNILTAEDPVEYTLSGIGQVQIRENIGLTFAAALRSFLRQDPEIILVGEIRDLETADIATKAALTGHLVLSTLHTNSAIGAITRLLNMGLPSYLVSSALSLAVGQRLVRQNCTVCSVPIDVEEALLSFDSSTARLIRESQNFEPGKILKGTGCDACNHTGYAGRRAIHEVLRVSSDIQHAINKNASENEMLSIAASEGFRPMSHVGVAHILSGELCVEEYLRVIPRTEDRQ